MIFAKMSIILTHIQTNEVFGKNDQKQGLQGVILIKAELSTSTNTITTKKS
jgi:hypothetical protein